MCPLRRFLSIFVFFSMGVLVSIATVPAFAGGPGGRAGSPKPRPDVEKKVYTNEDLEALAAQYGGPARQNPQAVSQAVQQTSGVSTGSSRLTALSKDQNPVWYAQQAVSMQAELAGIDGQIVALHQPPASDASPGGGFGLYTCCPGVTTYNRIDVLMQQRREITAQMNALEDTARENGFSPGMLRDSDQILQAAESRVTATPQQRLAALAKNEKALSAKLGQVQETLGSIDEQAASQNITLASPTTTYGGSMLTNNILDLDNQARELQQKISDIQDAARTNGLR